MKKSMFDFCIGNTTADTAKKAMEDNLDVISTISAEMLKDDENDSGHLLQLYAEATDEERGIMDTMLICICGWCMDTIISMSASMEE